MARLRAVGVQPAEVITDGSALYPSALATIWPAAAHQLCLFHETRRLTRAVLGITQRVQRHLPTPSPTAAASRPLSGRLLPMPPTDDPDAPEHQRWQWRQALLQAGRAAVHALAAQGYSHRAIGRQLRLDRRPVKQWLKRPPPTTAAAA